MTIIKWGDISGATGIFTGTELDSLTNTSNKITTSAISNHLSGELDVYADFILYLATQGTARSSGAFVPLYILPQVNSQYPYGGDSLDPAGNLLAGSFQFDAATTARYAVIRAVILPPDDFYILVRNNTGQTFAASGNTLYMRRYNMESA